jgi:hypothetical protein
MMTDIDVLCTGMGDGTIGECYTSQIIGMQGGSADLRKSQVFEKYSKPYRLLGGV